MFGSADVGHLRLRTVFGSADVGHLRLRTVFVNVDIGHLRLRTVFGSADVGHLKLRTVVGVVDVAYSRLRTVSGSAIINRSRLRTAPKSAGVVHSRLRTAPPSVSWTIQPHAPRYPVPSARCMDLEAGVKSGGSFSDGGAHDVEKEVILAAMPQHDPLPEANERLLQAISDKLPALEALLEQTASHWGYEDPIYRFYHQSFKVYALQDATEHIVTALSELAPDRQLNQWFTEIVAEGTGREFAMEVNQRWTAETRPILEAFFHARFFLEMACKYGRELELAPTMLPSGWAALLYLYDMR